MLRWYQSMMARRPILTQAITTGLLMGTGDIIAQQAIEKRGSEHEFKRTARMMTYGTVIFGPCAAHWYRFLATRVVLKNKNAEILARVAMDQAFFSPTFLAVFLSGMAYVDGRDPLDNVQRNFVPVLQTNYMVWPWVQLVNFKFIAPNQRLTFANTVAIGWNCYLSWRTVGLEEELQEAREVVEHILEKQEARK